MNGCPRSILLQKQDAWPLWIGRVFLDNHHLLNTVEHFSCGQSVLDQLIVFVFRYAHVASAYQGAHSPDELSISTLQSRPYGFQGITSPSEQMRSWRFQAILHHMRLAGIRHAITLQRL